MTQTEVTEKVRGLLVHMGCASEVQLAQEVGGGGSVRGRLAGVRRALKALGARRRKVGGLRCEVKRGHCGVYRWTMHKVELWRLGEWKTASGVACAPREVAE